MFARHSDLKLIIVLLSFCQLKAQTQSFPLTATGYDSHAELRWETPAGFSPDTYKIFRSTNGVDFSFLKNVSQTHFLDFTGFAGNTPDNYNYYVQALNGIGAVLITSETSTATLAEMNDEALLDMVQRYTFRYFWEFGHPLSGMARERNTSGDIVTSGGTGFGIMALLAGIERGFITRAEGRDRLLQLAGFLQFADKFHGVFPHWMNGETGKVVPFSQFDDGGDLVETAFLMQGLLCARQYFDQNDALETALRDAITQLWEGVEWDFYRKNNSGVLYWHWSPNFGWQMNFPLRGFNETMIAYILAIASPTHPVPASLWNSGWTSQNYANGLTWFGIPLEVGPGTGGPLFFAHYSFLGFDPRNKKDAFCNYFARNQHHSLINRAYCIANPEGHEGYSADCWGLTASDDPFGYSAHEASGFADNGTITPTAALSSMPYTPTESLAALKHFYREHGAELWGEMGFFDAFNLDQNWFADSYLAIDQGPIVVMIENYRSGLLWNLFMANPEIEPALSAIGFTEDFTSTRLREAEIQWEIFPNPAAASVDLRCLFLENQTATLDLTDVRGQIIRRFFDKKNMASGESRFSVSVADLPAGIYLFRLESEAGVFIKKFVKN